MQEDHFGVSEKRSKFNFDDKNNRISKKLKRNVRDKIFVEGG